MKPLIKTLLPAALLALAALTACGGPQPPSPAPQTKAELETEERLSFEAKVQARKEAMIREEAEARQQAQARKEARAKETLEEKHFTKLSDLVTTTARKLALETNAKKVLLYRSDIIDSVTGETCNPFSVYLRDALEAGFSHQGFIMVDDEGDADLRVRASYRRDGALVRVFIKYWWGADDKYNSLAQRIRADRLPMDAFAENLDVKMKCLVGRLLQERRMQKIMVNPLLEANDKYASEFSNFLTLKIKTAITEHGMNELVAEKPARRVIARTRGLVAAKKVKNLQTSDAAIAGADAVLEGVYFKSPQGMQLHLELKAMDGAVLASADGDVEKNLITLSLENPQAKDSAKILDVAGSKNAGKVRVSTTKGGGHSLYYAGQAVQFRLQVAEPLYVYVFTRDAKGATSLLYPYAGDPVRRLQPNRVYTIPGEQDDWEIQVEPPFGLDTVKVFASEVPLPLPRLDRGVRTRSFVGNTRALGRRKKAQTELADMGSINPVDLVDYFRGAAFTHGTRLYEDSVFVETQARP